MPWSLNGSPLIDTGVADETSGGVSKAPSVGIPPRRDWRAPALDVQRADDVADALRCVGGPIQLRDVIVELGKTHSPVDRRAGQPDRAVDGRLSAADLRGLPLREKAWEEDK